MLVTLRCIYSFKWYYIETRYNTISKMDTCKVAWFVPSCLTSNYVILFAISLLGFCNANTGIQTLSCDAVKYAYGSKDGFNSVDVPSFKIEGSHLEICSRDRTCCTQDMESKLSAESKAEFNKLVDNMIGLLQTTFSSRTNKFDTFFTELLDNSKTDLHDMFLRTYGILYQQNNFIFMDLFRDLRAYYKGKDMNLLDVLDKFFSDLLEKMFVLLHQEYEFDDTYLECITGHMTELKPFGDVPAKMSTQVKRSFIAARTFVQGLAVGRDVIKAVSKLDMTGSCRRAVTKMRYCPYCVGQPYNKPCNNYCMNVMKGCLAHYADLNKEWNTYIDALKSLSERLEGPFNIEAVVDPIDVKISDAIMNFQEGSEGITTKVFQGCGTPPPTRAKREAASSYDEYAGWKYERKGYVRPTTAAGTSLDRLVRDIEEKITPTRDCFKNMPNVVCNDIAAQIFEDDNCWNGMSVDRYLPDVMKDGLQNQINNPEVDVDVRKPNFIISQQLLQLKLITNKLTNAHNGIDVDWIDTSPEYFDDGSADGSGSGSGSGDGGYIFNHDNPFADDGPKGRGPDLGFPGYNDNSNDFNNNYESPDIIFDPNDHEYSHAASRHDVCSVTSLMLVLLVTLMRSYRWQHS